MIPKRVLLVEDDPDDVELALLSFEEAGFAFPVDVVTDGNQALGYLRRRAEREAEEPGSLPALVLLDMRLPKMGGLELLEGIRADPRLAALPVAVLSTSCEPAERKEAERLGVRAFFRKPMDFRQYAEVVARVEGILGSGRAV